MQRRNLNATLPAGQHHGSTMRGGSNTTSMEQELRDKQALRRKRKRLLLRNFLGQYFYDDGPFFVLVGALGCGLALILVAVGYRLLGYMFFSGKHMQHDGHHGTTKQATRTNPRLLHTTTTNQQMHRHTTKKPPHSTRQTKRRGHADNDDETGDNNGDDDSLEPLPFNSIYHVPEAMETMGDRSSEYAQLRRLYDTELLPDDNERSLQFVHDMTKPLPPSFLSSSSPLLPALLAAGGGGGGGEGVHHSDQVARDDYGRVHHHQIKSDADDDNDNDDDDDEPVYDIFNCPYEPPRNYPREWNLVHDVLNHWPADDTNIPTSSGIHQGLCVFDYQEDYDKALHYRELEQPFVVVHDPRVARTAERWHNPEYVEQMVGPNVLHRAEHNVNNHFLYHMPVRGGSQGRGRGDRRRLRQKDHGGGGVVLRDLQGRPAKVQNQQAVPEALRMTFRDWLVRANVTDDEALPTRDHWYFRLIGCGYMGADGSCDQGSTEALFDELPFFQPLLPPSSSSSSSPSSSSSSSSSDGENDGRGSNALYLGNPEEQMGIHCRFGMKGVIAENHFDASRNAIAVLMGQRRYILSHPKQCPNLALLPKGHESARHSAVDYTNPDLQRYPEFAHATANEVVLQPGQVLYLPTNWFHYIVSLDLNYQCNTRSGDTEEYWPPIHDCGF
ncbi:hypothetical protein ACA910_021469 [Epithemia clementina (nom. ined.)]